MRAIGIVVLAIGILALVYGGIHNSMQTREVKVGTLEVSLNEKRQLNVPLWAGVALALVGGGLLVSGRK